jgi:hypothetical protein
MKMSTPANAPFNEKADKPEKSMPTPSELETPQKVEDISVEKVRAVKTLYTMILSLRSISGATW